MYDKTRLRTHTCYVCCCDIMEWEILLFSCNACVNKHPAQANVWTHVPGTCSPSSLLASANTFSPLRYQIDLKANHWQPLHLSIHISTNSLIHFLTLKEPTVPTAKFQGESVCLGCDALSKNFWPPWPFDIPLKPIRRNIPKHLNHLPLTVPYVC